MPHLKDHCTDSLEILLSTREKFADFIQGLVSQLDELKLEMDEIRAEIERRSQLGTSVVK